MKKTIINGFLILAMSWFVPFGAASQDGSVDPSFKVAFSGWWCQPWMDGGNSQAVVQPDGKILMTGNASGASTPAHKHKWLVRFNLDGTLDTQFDNNLPASINGGRGTGVTIQADGKIIFCTNIDIQRLNADGTLDASYQPAVRNNIFGGIHVQKDQKLLIARSASPYLVRLNVDGSQDNSFAPTFNGKVYEAIPLSNGKILVGGIFTQCNGKNTGRVVLLNNDGSLDSDFDLSSEGLAGGTVVTVSAESDESFLIGGYGFTTFNKTSLKNKGVFRVSNKGKLDVAFDNAETGPNGFSNVSGGIGASGIGAMIPLTDGKIILTGTFLNYGATTNVWGIVRLNNDGSLDPDFKSYGGFANTPNPGNLFRYPAAAIYESDSSIIVTGTFSAYGGEMSPNIVRIKNTIDKAALANIEVAKIDPAAKYCVHTPVKVAYEATGSYDPNNVFTVQLSDKDGSFANPSSIGTLNGAALNGVISVVIPGNAVQGAKYRMRVVSSNPAVVGNDNGSDLTINILPAITAKLSKPSKPEICLGEEVVLDYQAGPSFNPVTYTWDNNVQSNRPFKPTQTKTYTVTATDQGTGCVNEDSIKIVVNPLPDIPVASTPSPAIICEGEDLTLYLGKRIPGVTFTWDKGVTSGTAFKPTKSETYTLTGKNNTTGCTATDSIKVVVNPVPVVAANADPSDEVCMGTSLILSGSGASKYEWTNNVNDGVAFTPMATETYTVTGENAEGCKAEATITITVKDTFAVRIDETACAKEGYLFGDQLLTQTGIYEETFVASNGCDSIVTLNLDIKTLDLSVLVSETGLSAAVGMDTYQWLDCDNGNQPIAGATQRTYKSEISGNFAVIVSRDGCEDTTICYDFTKETNIGNVDSEAKSVRLYPNPTKDKLFLSTGTAFKDAEVRILTVTGQASGVIEKVSGTNPELDVSALAAGIYFVEIQNAGTVYRIRFVKN